MFGEAVRAVKPENIVQEMMLKVYFYNEYNKLRGESNCATDFILT